MLYFKLIVSFESLWATISTTEDSFYRGNQVTDGKLKAIKNLQKIIFLVISVIYQ